MVNDPKETALNQAMIMRDTILSRDKRGNEMTLNMLANMVNNLCDILMTDYHLTLTKPVRGPYKAYKCDSCSVYDLAEDERVASATIDRLIRNANSSSSVVTMDEAMNLLHFFEMHRKFVTKDDVK